MSASLVFQSVGPMPLSDGSLYLNVQFTVAAPVGAITTQALTTGNNTVVVPTGNPTICIIQPPVGNASTITLKGVNADTGILQNPTAPSFISLGAGVASFVLSVGGNMTVAFTWI